jgi:plasmid stabilization system protein ParE
MKALRIHEGARREANQATVRYAERSLPAARRFRDELLAGFSSAAAFPLRYPSYLHGTRRVLLKKFPYFIVFLDWQDEVYVVVVAHAKRRPGYWKRRV